MLKRVWAMATSNSEPPHLLLRMSSPPPNHLHLFYHQEPPELLWLSHPAARKKESVLSRRWNKSWKILEEDRVQDFKHSPISSMNLTNEPKLLMMTENEHLTPTWLSSTPSLLTWMGMDLETSCNLQDCLTPQQPHINDNMSMMMILKNTYPELKINKRKKSQHQEERELEKKTCHGIHHLPNQPGEKFVSKYVKPFRSSVKTSVAATLQTESQFHWTGFFGNLVQLQPTPHDHQFSSDSVISSNWF